VSKKDVLKTYRAKRDFEKTPEPSGKKGRKGKGNIYVMQKHAASHLHYDLRLQIGGVLVSWAVPKGPSTDPRIKRLAIQTEDHPLDYANFEGVIPEGYGAGTVMVWDIGTYENIKDISMQTALKEGRIEINLHGKKLQGAYALIQTTYDKAGGKKQWLFFKMKDDYADARRNPVSTQNKSALTGRTMAQIKKDKDAVYE